MTTAVIILSAIAIFFAALYMVTDERRKQALEELEWQQKCRYELEFQVEDLANKLILIQKRIDAERTERMHQHNEQEQLILDKSKEIEALKKQLTQQNSGDFISSITEKNAHIMRLQEQNAEIWLQDSKQARNYPKAIELLDKIERLTARATSHPRQLRLKIHQEVTELKKHL